MHRGKSSSLKCHLCGKPVDGQPGILHDLGGARRQRCPAGHGARKKTLADLGKCPMCCEPMSGPPGQVGLLSVTDPDATQTCPRPHFVGRQDTTGLRNLCCPGFPLRAIDGREGGGYRCWGCNREVEPGVCPHCRGESDKPDVVQRGVPHEALPEVTLWFCGSCGCHDRSQAHAPGCDETKRTPRVSVTYVPRSTKLPVDAEGNHLYTWSDDD